MTKENPQPRELPALSQAVGLWALISEEVPGSSLVPSQGAEPPEWPSALKTRVGPRPPGLLWSVAALPAASATSLVGPRPDVPLTLQSRESDIPR